MSRSECFDELMNIINQIKNEKAKKDYDNIAKLLDQLIELKVTAQDIKESKVGCLLGGLKNKKNENVTKKIEFIINKWNRIMKPEKNSKKSSDNKSLKKKEEKKEDKKDENNEKNVENKEKIESKDNEESYNLVFQPTGSETRDCAQKIFFKHLKVEQCEKFSLYDIAKKAVEIENKIFEKKKSGTLYDLRCAEIIKNLKDVENKQFRLNILNNVITADELPTIDIIQIVSKTKKDILMNEIKGENEEMRTDYHEKKMDMTGGTEKCRKCKSFKVTYSQMQTRSADEPMTTFYHCHNCGFGWKE